MALENGGEKSLTTKHYYQKIYSIYTAESVAYFVVGLISFLISWTIGKNILLALVVTFPFILLFLFTVNRHVRLKFKLKKLPDTNEVREASPLNEGQYFLGFLPAPTLHMVIFSTDGYLVGTMRDKRDTIWMWILPAFLLIFLPRNYILTDSKGNIVGEYRSRFGLNGQIDILNGNQEKIGTYKQSKQLGKKSASSIINPYGIRQYGGEMRHGSEFVVNQTYDKRQIIHYSCGWMPAYYSKYFPDPNMPFLTFTEGATEDEKRIGYCFCLDYLQQQNH